MVVDSAALVAQVPVLADPVVEARLPVPVDLAHKARLLDLVHLVVESRLPVLVHLVVEAVLLQLLRSRQSFSAAMARNTTSRPPTYEPVPRSR